MLDALYRLADQLNRQEKRTLLLSLAVAILALAFLLDKRERQR